MLVQSVDNETNIYSHQFAKGKHVDVARLLLKN